jgi:hypothetical protein
VRVGRPPQVYLPVVTRTLRWMNQNNSVPGHCFLTLAPEVDCSTWRYQAVLGLAAADLLVFAVGFPAFVFFAAQGQRPELFVAVTPLTRSLRDGKELRSHHLVLFTFLRRVTVAVIVGSVSEFTQTMPMLIVSVITVLLIVQVAHARARARPARAVVVFSFTAHACPPARLGAQMLVKPYHGERPNKYSAWTLCVLLWAYSALLITNVKGHCRCRRRRRRRCCCCYCHAHPRCSAMTELPRR